MIAGLVAGYYFLTNSQDLAFSSSEKNHAQKVGSDIRQTYKVTVWNGYYSAIIVYLELPQVWADQGVLLEKHGRDLRLSPFSKGEVEITLQVPLDLIAESELHVDLVKSVERAGKTPILNGLKLSVSSLADEMPTQ